MSRWIEAFKGHPFHGQLEALERTIAGGTYPANSPADGHEEIARLRKVLAFVESSLRGIDPEIASSNLLGSLQGSIQGVQNEVNAFFSNGNVAHLRNANANADSLITNLQTQVSLPFGVESAAVQSAAQTYQLSLEKSAADSRAALADLIQSAREESTEFSRAHKSIIERIEGFEKRLSDMDTQVAGQLAGYNTSFQSSENARGERFEKWMQGNDSKLDDSFTAYTLKAGKAIQAIDEFQLQAGKVLGSVVDTGGNPPAN